MPTQIPRIRTVEDDVVVVRDAFVLTFFVNESHDRLLARVAGVLALYADFVGLGSLPYRLDDEGEVVDVRARDPRALVQEIFHRDAEADLSVIRLVGAIDDETGYGFKYIGDALPDPRDPDLRNLVSLWLPTELCDEVGWDFIADFSSRIAAMLPFSYGYGSPALAYRNIMQALPAARRYPGLDIALGIACRVDIDDKALGVYWLNFFGDVLSANLGGEPQLAARLRAPITVNRVDDSRLVVRLGTGPEVGDNNRRIDLPLYRQLAEVIESQLHVPGSVYFPDEHGLRDAEAMAAWHRRFLTHE